MTATATTIATETVVSPAAFAAAVALVAPYATDGILRPIMSGINIRTHSDTLTLIAADEFTVAEYSVPCDLAGDIDLTIPAKELAALAKTAAKAPSQLTITQDGDTLTLLTCDGAQTIAAVSDQFTPTYPDVGQIIRRESPVKLSVACNALRPAVLTFDGFARHQSEVIKLAHADDKLALSAHHTGAALTVNIDAGATRSIDRYPALNYTYLARIARTTVKGNVVFGIGDPKHMVMVQWSDLPGLTVGIMPMVIGG